jgi:hypothetical protein
MDYGTLSTTDYYYIKHLAKGIFECLPEDDITYLTNKKFVMKLFEGLYDDYLKDQGLKSY